MSEYRSVNFFDLCRLCAATQGNKVNVYSDAGRKQDLSGKINESLPVRVDENDDLPKTICELCVQQLQQIAEYRQKCSNTDTMLRGCLGSPKLKNEGRVYIKDSDSAKAGPGGSKPATNIVTLKNMKQTLVPLVSSQQQQQQIQVQQQQQQHVQHQNVVVQTIAHHQQQQQLDTNTMTLTSANQDFLSNIVQQAGINEGNEPQYTYTIKEIPASQQSVLDHQQRLQTYSSVDEFLKPKSAADGTKMQYNLVVNNNQLQHITATSQSSGSPQTQAQVKQVLSSNNAPYVLTTNATTGIRTVTQQQTGHQQQQQQHQTQQQKNIQMVQTGQKQCMIIKDNSQQVYQIKLEPQMSTVDGQTIYQLTTPTPTFQTITSQPQQQQNKVMNPIQFTTLTNVNSAKPSPTMITIQDTPGKGQTATQITPVGRIASTTITRKTPLVLKHEGGTTPQVKYVTTTSQPSSTGMSAGNSIIVQSAGGAKLATTATKNSPKGMTMKTMKVISSSGAAVPTTTTTLTTLKAAQVVSAEPKIIPLQTIGSGGGGNEDVLTYEVELEKQNKPTCVVCQKEFKRKEHLAQHMKLHQGVRPFKCDQCDKAFNRKEHLLRHRTSHTGAKSFKCEHCQKMFSRKDNLNKHKRKHTGGGGTDNDADDDDIKMDVSDTAE